MPAPNQPHINNYTKFEMDMCNIGGEYRYKRIYQFPGISDTECWRSIMNFHVNFKFDFKVAHTILQVITTPHKE